MEGVNRRQIKYRYWKLSKQKNLSGPFSPEEDALLLALYQKYGPQWCKMKNYFKRSYDQIWERYLNVLVPKKIGPWSFEEDKLLIAMIRKYGYGEWKKISEKVPGRSNHVCLLRAKRLLNWSVNYYSEKGLGEYDPDVYDPELFAKILRPIPPAKNLTCNNIKYEKQKLPRENALKTLLKALEIVEPEYAAGIRDLNAIDVSWMSTERLNKLSDILRPSFPEMEKSETVGNVPVRYLTQHPPRRKRRESESDDDDDNNDDEEDAGGGSQSSEKEISEEAKDLIYSALEKILEQGDILQPKRNKVHNSNTRQWAEMSLYTAFLYKQFHCKSLCDKDEDVVFNKIDYRKSIDNIVSYFIQPPVYDNQFITLAPNLTTMTGMETIQATENRLHSMSECVSHSKEYIDYLCERRRSSPQCLQCLHKSSNIVSNTTLESVMCHMEGNFFLLDKTLDTSACIENASIEELNNSCVCKALSDSAKSVQLLKKRFLSLFTWPALLSTVDLSEQQEHTLCTVREGYNYFYDMNAYQKETWRRERKKETTERFKERLGENCQKRKRTSSEDKNAKEPKLEDSIFESDSLEQLDKDIWRKDVPQQYQSCAVKQLDFCEFNEFSISY